MITNILLRVDTAADDAMNMSIDETPLVDLETLAFTDGIISSIFIPLTCVGGHTMTNRKVLVPEGAFKKTGPGYETVNIPAPEARGLDAGEKLIPIESLPSWAHPAFKGMESLNCIQSKVYPKAFGSDGNLLMCAPTGAGKTNVALLTVFREIGKHRLADGSIDRASFKIVYVAPMKALVQEMVSTFTRRLEPYGLSVAELTGDAQLTQAQLADTQLIVTTPEKWDVVTRKGGEAGHFTRLVRLVVLDEIHLLHDERGPVLEALVARTLRIAEQTQQWTRLVGLSATLPNYADVGRFLRCDKSSVFYFDASYRPCPLAQEFVGVTERNALKRLALMNELVYERVAERAGRVQTIVFVHSRKDTVRTAKYVLEQAITRKSITKFNTISSEDIGMVQSAELASLLPHGIGVHHAGLGRSDRSLVEQLFADGRLVALVSTATLAWGVNLPAHTVIIKGTQVYSPERGAWTQLSPQDTLQMLGRAGRPQYDRQGEGIVITQHSELQFYLSLLTTQLPIESQMVGHLLEHVNAELVTGSISSLADAGAWIGYTYLAVRMARVPHVYGVPEGMDPKQPRRLQLAHAALTALDATGLARYDRRTGNAQPTELGRIAAHYYLSHKSVATYVAQLRPHHDEADLLRVFSMSHEFALLPVRHEEKGELQRLADRVPFPVKGEAIDDPAAKINVLLQSYISRLALEGFALAADMVYVTQSAGRILRALFELCLRRGWSRLAKRALGLCKAVQQRQWAAQTPLRQTAGHGRLPAELLRKLEAKDFPFARLFDLNAAELGELVRVPRMGRSLFAELERFPRLAVTGVSAVPIAKDLLRIQATVEPRFVWDDEVLGRAPLTFQVIVEDVDEEHVLHHETLLVKERDAGKELTLSLTVPIFDPMPPVCFISILSDRFIGADAREAVILQGLTLPDDTMILSDVVNDSLSFPDALQSIPGLAESYAAIGITEFNSIQSTVLPAVYRSDSNVFVGMPSGTGRTLVGELAIARSLAMNPTCRIVYLCPHASQLDYLVTRMTSLFASLLPEGRLITRLTGDTTRDPKLFEASAIAIATSQAWDALSRRWKTRKTLQTVSLVIADDLHTIASEPVYETIMGRMRYISAFLESSGRAPIRIIALSLPVVPSKDMASWLGVPSSALFNFGIDARPSRLAVHLQAFPGGHHDSRLLAMLRPIHKMCHGKSSIVFCEDRQQCRSSLAGLISLASADALRQEKQEAFGVDLQVKDGLIKEGLRLGYGIIANGSALKSQMEQLFQEGHLNTLLVSRSALYDLDPVLRADVVAIQGTQYWNGAERRFQDYPLADLMAMLGRARSDAFVCCGTPQKASLKRLLSTALPIESTLDAAVLPGVLCAEIVSGSVRSCQEAVDLLTWSFLYRRLGHNPSFYGLPERSARAVSEYLSQIIETAIEELTTAKCVELEESEEGDCLVPLNLGIVAAHYNLSHLTIEMYALSIQPGTRLRGILEILAAAAEFDSLPIRREEWRDLSALYERCPVQSQASPSWDDPHAKAMVLLQSHLSRMSLTPDLEQDQRVILPIALRAAQAMVDVIASHGWLQPALAAMEMAQMLIQAQWDSESPLRQLPGMTNAMLKIASELSIESVFDLIDDEDKRNTLSARIDQSQLAALATAVNKYPNVELDYQLSAQETEAGVPISVQAQLKRLDGPVSDLTVPAPFFSDPREEAWWLCLGSPSERTILAIKRVACKPGQSVCQITLDFTAPPTSVSLKLYLISECWLGCDQEFDLSIVVNST